MRDIARAAFKTGSGSAISMFFGAITSKIMAVILGPGGIGLYSILMQVQQTVSAAGTFGGSAAMVQGIASRHGVSRDRFIVTVFWIFLVGGLAASIGLVVFAPWIAPMTIGDDDGESIGLIRWMALPVVLWILLTYLMALLNGMRAIGKLAIIQIAVSGIGALLAYPISELVDCGFVAAFILLMTCANGGGIAVGIVTASKQGWLRPVYATGLKPMVEREQCASFFSMALTMLITSVVATGTLLLTRSLFVHYEGIESAGIFNVAWTLGMIYPMVVLTSFGTYYFPTLSKTRDTDARNELMEKMFRLSTLLMIPILMTAIVLKPLIIGILYSDSFLPSLETVRWMFIGGYLKTASWVFAMPMIAYADMRVFFWTEILWHSGLIGAAVLATMVMRDMQVIGFGFLLLYAIYLIYTHNYAHRRYDFSVPRRTGVQWAGGLMLIALASLWTWSELQVDVTSATVCIGVSIVYSIFILDRDERKRIIELLGGKSTGE